MPGNSGLGHASMTVCRQLRQCIYEIVTQGNKKTSMGTAGVKFSDDFLPTLNPKSTTAPFFDDTNWSCFVTQVEGLDSCLSELDLSLTPSTLPSVAYRACRAPTESDVPGSPWASIMPLQFKTARPI